MSDEASPRILSCTWGKMEIEGIGVGKDFKLFPGGGRAWDWTETGTSHFPGIQAADVQELVDHGCEVVILSRGMLRALQTRQEALTLLESLGIEVHLRETRRAAQFYNELAHQGRRVGGLFHSTC